MKTRAHLTISLAVIILAMLASLAFGSEQEIRDAWTAYVQPVFNPKEFTSAFYYHRARENAISILTASNDKKDPALLEALGYFQLRDYQYRKADEAFKAALRHNSKDPLLQYLSANTSAILLIAEPEKMQEQSKEALARFRRLMELDPENALPPLQGASVAFDSERPDLALPLVEAGLAKPAFMLYKLPVPEDLSPDPALSAAAWWWAQSELWVEMIARASNCAKALLRQADRLALKGDTEGAIKLCEQAKGIGQLFAHTDPPLAVGVASGLEVQAQALQALLLRTPEQEATKLRAELAAIRAAQARLKQAWIELQAKETKTPPASLQARLENQKALAEEVLAGL